MESCDLLKPAAELSDPVKFAYGHYLLELSDLITVDGHPNGEIFSLLEKGLDLLRSGPATTAFLRSFELQLLKSAGFDPRPQQCHACNRTFAQADTPRFDPMHGSFYCRSCAQHRNAALEVSPPALDQLGLLANASLAQTQSIRFEGRVAQEVTIVLGQLLALQLVRPVRSVKLISTLGTKAELGGESRSAP